MRAFFVSFAVITSIISFCALPAPALNSAIPFRPGEKLVYDISWMGILAGEGVLNVKRQTKLNGFDVYELKVSSRTVGWVSDFYFVDDNSLSYFDIEKLHSHKIDISLKEGSYRKTKIIEFDQARQVATYSINGNTPEEYQVFPDCQDALSALYVLRTMRENLKVGETISIPLFDDKKNYELLVKIIKKERINLLSGMVDTIVVEPKLKTEGVFQRKGKMRIWLADDENLAPVQMRSKIVVGSFLAKLREHKGVNINYIPYKKPEIKK